MASLLRRPPVLASSPILSCLQQHQQASNTSNTRAAQQLLVHAIHGQRFRFHRNATLPSYHHRLSSTMPFPAAYTKRPCSPTLSSVTVTTTSPPSPPLLFAFPAKIVSPKTNQLQHQGPGPSLDFCSPMRPLLFGTFVHYPLCVYDYYCYANTKTTTTTK